MSFFTDPRFVAKEFRRRYSLSLSPGTRQLDSIVRALGGYRQTERSLPPGIAGATTATDDCSSLFAAWVVTTQRGLPAHRLRFTLSHEIGHLALRTSNVSVRGEERWCNAFAEELLMPRETIMQRYNKLPPSTELIQDLADRAQVSYSAALVRLNTALSWNRGFITFSYVNSALCLTGMICVPRRAHYRLQPSPDTLRKLPSCSNGAREWLRFGYEGEELEILCQIARHGRNRWALLDAGDLGAVCEEIAREQTVSSSF